MRLDLQEPLIIQENVEAFSTEEIHRILGHVYEVEVAMMSPHEYGFPVSRPRKWTILRHRAKTKAATTPWNIFVKIFQTDLLMGEDKDNGNFWEKPAWDCYFDAEPYELFHELCWAASRPESRSRERGVAFPNRKAFEKACKDDPGAVRAAFLSALTGAELAALLEYRTKKPGVAYSLNQNPEVTFTACARTHLHAIIKNTGILWPSASRSSSFYIFPFHVWYVALGDRR